jgi:hypothetical protein
MVWTSLGGKVPNDVMIAREPDCQSITARSWTAHSDDTAPRRGSHQPEGFFPSVNLNASGKRSRHLTWSTPSVRHHSVAEPWRCRVGHRRKRTSSTVHWVADRDRAATVDEAVQKVHSRRSRKKMFTRHQIGASARDSSLPIYVSLGVISELALSSGSPL